MFKTETQAAELRAREAGLSDRAAQQFVRDFRAERATIRCVVARFEKINRESRNFYRYGFGLASELAAAGVAIVIRPASTPAKA